MPNKGLTQPKITPNPNLPEHKWTFGKFRIFNKPYTNLKPTSNKPLTQPGINPKPTQKKIKPHES